VETLSRCHETVRGNHDKAAAGLLSPEWFNSAARRAILWTRENASPEILERIAALKQGPLETRDGILLCHGTPMDEDRYMMDERSLVESFQFLAENNPGVRVCFHGHTHVPLAARRKAKGGEPELLFEEEIRIEGSSTYLINPGSVGQPRDGNPRASFGILDTERGIYKNVRVDYDVAGAQRKILAAGLPAALAQRLEKGL
jgi:diadenosine tetraphosphatase ApaH/serine/threonine PP2A family protein phosphatase